MTLCPIAVTVGCRKCPAFSLCPLKSVIGDYTGPEARGGSEKSNKPPRQPKK